MTNDANGFLMAEGGKSATFREIGAQYDGHIVSYEMRQQSDFKTGELLTWPDGAPRMQLVVTLRTELNEEEGDNGIRLLYVKGNMQKAIKDAVQKSGERGIAVNGRLFVRYVGEGAQPDKRLDPPKNYIAKYGAPSFAVPVDERGNEAPPPDDSDLPF